MVIDMGMLHDEDNLRRVAAYLETLGREVGERIGDCPDVVGGGTETCMLCGERQLVPWLHVCYPCVNGPCDHVGTDRVRWQEYAGCGEGAGGEDLTTTLHRLLPTPTGQDGHNNGAPSQLERRTPPLNAEMGGALNPDWVDWLMGFPPGWSAV
jgi:hypothetical protein